MEEMLRRLPEFELPSAIKQLYGQYVPRGCEYAPFPADIYGLAVSMYVLAAIPHLPEFYLWKIGSSESDAHNDRWVEMERWYELGKPPEKFTSLLRKAAEDQVHHNLCKSEAFRELMVDMLNPKAALRPSARSVLERVRYIIRAEFPEQR